MTQTAPAERAGRWMEDPGFGVYVHIPFCTHRCHYCDFNTYAVGDPEASAGTKDAYVAALIADIRRTAESAGRGPATSVFFGGGTPTLLPAAELGRILGVIRDEIGLAPRAEITVEANPETVDETYFETLLAHGFNRVSIGVQSLVPHVLEGLGRTHGPEAALAALAAARRAGVENLSADLIYGSQWESAEDWDASLHGITAAAPDHISAYALTIEEGTPLSTLISTGRVRDIDDDVQAARFERAEQVLGEAGLSRYEISNWGRPGRASRHNVLYWSGGEYFGFGAGAHGHLDGRRYWSVRLPRDFVGRVRSGETTEAGSESLDPEARAAEALMLGLRLRSGIDRAGFVRRYGTAALSSRQEEMGALVEEGLLADDPGALALTDRGARFASEVAVRLL